MSDHDPLCPLSPTPTPVGSRCLCHLIRRTRADERERIAQAIEAAKQNMVESESWFVLSLAARIARSGSQSKEDT